MSNPDIDLIGSGEDASIKKFRIAEAEKDGTLEHLVSTYDHENDQLIPGTVQKGLRVVDFANLL